MRRPLLVLVSGILLLAAGCRRGSEEGGSVPPVSPAEVPVRVEVTNNYALPVEIFAIGASINHRMGTVHPGMHGQFTLPPTMIGNGAIELQARSGDGGEARSGQLLLAPGALVDFLIAPQLFNSTATIRR